MLKNSVFMLINDTHFTRLSLISKNPFWTIKKNFTNVSDCLQIISQNNSSVTKYIQYVDIFSDFV